MLHGDFRLGNLIIGEDGVRAVLDWELVHRGDPLQDLGYLCVRAWRFGGEHPVGGFGTYEDLFRGYERVSGREVDPACVRWWEVFGTVWWGGVCMQQAWRHLSGAERSVELAAIGRRVWEQEYDVLLALARMRHGIPSTAELAAAVREFLEQEVVPATEGRLSFHARVAANVLAQIERELQSWPAGHRRGDAEMCAAIRAGTVDFAEVYDAIRETVVAKLRISNPRHLLPEDR